MKVVEALQELHSKVEKIIKKYCENCQGWDCDFCPFVIVMEEGENEHTY